MKLKSIFLSILFCISFQITIHATMVMPYTDSIGNEYPESAWWPAQINIDTTNGAHITWLAMKNINVLYDYLGKKKNNQLTKETWIPGATKDYFVNGSSYWSMYGSHMAEGGPNLNTLVHEQTFAIKDTLTGQVDQDGNPTYKSFFEGATAQ